MPLMRIPYTDPLPNPRIIPTSASATAGAVEALTQFLLPGAASERKAGVSSSTNRLHNGKKTLLLTGAGISVASGLSDYRGTQGTYTLNKTYRPIYYHEFVAKHDARKRYWARSFLGSANLAKARPNAAHRAIRELGRQGVVGSVITQNVDSFHRIAHPELPTIELHGYLRNTICLSCRREYPREEFQAELARLNPPWAAFLEEMIAAGALDTENPAERRRRGLKTNPDGDVDLGGGVDYSTFEYPACPNCLRSPPVLKDGKQGKVKVSDKGAWLPSSTAGVLKPAVIMFGESISDAVKVAAEDAVLKARNLLVAGSSLATYSAWRLAKKALELGIPIGILNMGGVRGEEQFFARFDGSENSGEALRIAALAEEILPEVVDRLAHSSEIDATTAAKAGANG